MTDSLLNGGHGQVESGRQPWLSSALFDGTLILAPAFVSTIIVLLFRDRLEGSHALPLWAWVSLVLMVDVAHVYATLFRTYLDAQARRRNPGVLMGVPLVCFFGGVLLYALGSHLFWSALAYLAVFHFVRQQYGFCALYSRKDRPEQRRFRLLDQALVYLATLYPVLWWHSHLPRNFNWFIDGDFVPVVPVFVSEAALIVYGATAIAYVLKELAVFIRIGVFNLPRNLLVAGTALSWWVGIVALDSDMAFTLTNVLSHGIPYMALVWLYHGSGSSSVYADKPTGGESTVLARLTAVALTSVPVFLSILIFLAFLEEGLWDGLVWREHQGFFWLFSRLPAVGDASILALIVPLLSLPQSTHYVLDGFIWRMKGTGERQLWSV